MKKVLITLTDAQFAALQSLELQTGEERSKLVRTGIAQVCQNHAIQFPDNMPKPSRKRKVLAE